MNRTISSQGIELIKSFEGYCCAAYKDTSDVWTIGYGHTSGVTSGMVCTREQAEAWLKYDVYKAENAVNSYDFMYNWTQYEFDALVSFTFNCGAGNLKKLLKNGERNKSQICDALPLYNKSNGKALTGLTRRRKAEAEMFRNNSSISKYYPKYNGDSVAIDKVLSAIGADIDYNKYAATQWLKRVPIADANNIKGYKGTAEQNLKIISLAKRGELKRV